MAKKPTFPVKKKFVTVKCKHRSAEFFYLEEMLALYAYGNPKVGKAKILKDLAKAFRALSKPDKAKYEDKAVAWSKKGTISFRDSRPL